MFTTVPTCSQKEAGRIKSCLDGVTRLVTLVREQIPGRGEATGGAAGTLIEGEEQLGRQAADHG